MKAANKARWMWGVACLAGWCGAGCTPWNSQPKIDPTRALIDARTVLREAAEDPHDVSARCKAMEAIGEVDAEEGGGVLKQALEDPNAWVRFAAAMSIGDIRYAPALSALQAKAGMFTGEIDKRTYCAVLYALYRLGDEKHLGDLAALLFDRDPEVRAFAAQVMGKMGNPAAIDLLRRAEGAEPKENVNAKYNMIEALAILGDPAYKDQLQGYAEGYWMDLQLEAIPALGREYSPTTMQILRNLLFDERFSPRAHVRAAGVMAKLGQGTPEGYNLCVEVLRNPGKFAVVKAANDRMAARNELASLQELAAISLGWMRQPDVVSVLYPLLQSPEGGVRVAAAMSILRLESPPRPAPPAVPAPARSAATEPSNTVRPPALRTSGAKD